MARRGKGRGHGGPASGNRGHGPANGSGWGGPAKGIGHNSGRALEFEPGNAAAAGPHSFDRSAENWEMIERLFEIAMTAKNDMVRVHACIACLDRLLGPPLPMVLPRE